MAMKKSAKAAGAKKKGGKKGGRRIIDPAIRERAMMAIAEGKKPLAVVARETGLSYQTIRNWAGKGEAPARKASKAAVDRPATGGGTAEMQALRKEVAFLKRISSVNNQLERLKLENQYLREVLALYR